MAEVTLHAAPDVHAVSPASHADGQQHPIKLYLVVWGWLFVLSACSYLVDYFGLHGYVRWTLILLFMVLKAGLIVAVFMHMAWERLALAYAILVPPVFVLVFTVLMLFEAHYTLLSRLTFFGVRSPWLRRCRADDESEPINTGDCRMRLFMVVLGAAWVVAVPAAAQDAAAGEKVFVQCKACHQIGETAKNAVGPVLNGVIGRKAGSVEGFSYSAANKNSGITWDEATFREYIKDPRAKVPGTKMAFGGVKDPKQIEDLLAYLKQFDAAGKKAELGLVGRRLAGM